MIKTLISTVLVALIISGCGSSDSDDNSKSGNIAMWGYLVSDKSAVLSFDSIKAEDSVITSTSIGNYTHEYVLINENEVKGSYREYDGDYTYKNGDYISFGPTENNTSSSYSLGSITSKMDVGGFLYSSRGGSGWSTTSGGITFSIFTDGKDCIISKLHESVTLYEGYTYNDVMEVTCEDKLDQQYASTNIIGIDRYKEYYQKSVGWIAKVNNDCIVSIAANGYKFLDDDNTTCVNTTTDYELLSN